MITPTSGSTGPAPLEVDTQSTQEIDALLESSPESEEFSSLKRLLRFAQQIDWDTLETDLELIREHQIVLNRRNSDETSEAVGRVADLLDDLIDTGESCGLK